MQRPKMRAKGNLMRNCSKSGAYQYYIVTSLQTPEQNALNLPADVIKVYNCILPHFHPEATHATWWQQAALLMVAAE